MKIIDETIMQLSELYKFPCVTLRLAIGGRGGERMPRSSGLNWGQRLGREQNQAYLAIPSEVQRSGFFPDVGVEFTLETDDGESWICARRQAKGKAIHTIADNSILGRYFRGRLGVDVGDAVVLAHLTRYGRLSVDIYKINDQTYFMDFSIERK
jgi:hypothetical protein